MYSMEDIMVRVKLYLKVNESNIEKRTRDTNEHTNEDLNPL